MKQHRSKIKNALSKEVPNWESEAIWESIENTLPAQRRYKKYLVYFIIFIVGLLALAYQFSTKDNNLKNIENTVNLKVINLAKNSSSNNSTLLDNKNKNLIDQTTSNSNNTSKFKYKKSKTINKNKIASNKKPNINKGISQAEITIVRRFSKINLNNSLLYNKHNNTQKEEEKIRISPRNKENKTVNSAILSNKLNIKFKSHDSKFYLATPRIRTNPKKGEFSNKPKYTLDQITGIYYNQRFLSSSTYNNWIEKKHSTETMLEATDLSISVQRYFKNNFSISLGIQFSRIIEEFVHKDSTVSISEIYSDTAYIYPNGLYVGGMVDKTTTNYRTIISPNRFKFISIPIGINYNHYIGKSSIQFGAGVNIDFWSRYTGYSFDLNGKTIHSDNELNDLYKRSLGFSSVFVHANYKININDKIGAFIGIKSIFDLNYSNTNKEISQKYNRFGAIAGVSYLIK